MAMNILKRGITIISRFDCTILSDEYIVLTGLDTTKLMNSTMYVKIKFQYVTARNFCFRCT